MPVLLAVFILLVWFEVPQNLFRTYVSNFLLEGVIWYMRHEHMSFFAAWKKAVEELNQK